MEESKTCPRGTDKAKIVVMIETQALIGKGTEKDPARIIYQYWDMKGKLMAERDEFD